jgi:hypothetical protein
MNKLTKEKTQSIIIQAKKKNDNFNCLVQRCLFCIEWTTGNSAGVAVTDAKSKHICVEGTNPEIGLSIQSVQKGGLFEKMEVIKNDVFFHAFGKTLLHKKTLYLKCRFISFSKGEKHNGIPLGYKTTIIFFRPFHDENLSYGIDDLYLETMETIEAATMACLATWKIIINKGTREEHDRQIKLCHANYLIQWNNFTYKKQQILIKIYCCYILLNNTIEFYDNDNEEGWYQYKDYDDIKKDIENDPLIHSTVIEHVMLEFDSRYETSNGEAFDEYFGHDEEEEGDGDYDDDDDDEK